MRLNIWFLVVLSLLGLVGVHCKLSLIDLDEIEMHKIKVYNQTRQRYGLEPIFYSRDLMSLAQKESIRLAETGALEPPLWLRPEKYRGFSVRITSKGKKQYYGQKICFQNVLDLKGGTKVIDINERCKHDDLDWRYEYEVGYGRAMDDQGHIFSVKVYNTHQRSNLDKEQDFNVKTKPTGLDSSEKKKVAESPYDKILSQLNLTTPAVVSNYEAIEKESNELLIKIINMLNGTNYF